MEKKLNLSSDDSEGTRVYHRGVTMCTLHIGESERQVQSALWTPLARGAVAGSVSQADTSFRRAVLANAIALQ